MTRGYSCKLIEDLWWHIKFWKSQEILLEVVIETLEKSGNFIIQNHDSRCICMQV